MGLFSNTDGKKERWESLRQTVDLGLKHFQRTGKALKEIRDDELYRIQYATFEQCCEAEWKITVRHADRLVAAYETSLEIGPVGQNVVSERQLRPLTTLPVGQRRAAFEEASEDGATAEAIERAVAKRRPRKKKSAVMKPLRFRLPGGTITITPNRKFTDLPTILAHLHQVIEQRSREAA